MGALMQPVTWFRDLLRKWHADMERSRVERAIEDQDVNLHDVRNRVFWYLPPPY